MEEWEIEDYTYLYHHEDLNSPKSVIPNSE